MLRNPEPFSEGTATHCSPCPENQLPQKHHRFTPIFLLDLRKCTLLLHVEHLDEMLAASTAQSTGAEVLWEQIRQRLTAQPYSPYSPICWRFSSFFSFTASFFLLAEAASLWQELVCKKILKSSCLSCVRELVHSGDIFHELATEAW